jgi:predicted O-methyltransferase YrrM
MKTFVLYRPEREERIHKVVAEMGLEATFVMGPTAKGIKRPAECSIADTEVACWEGHREIVKLAAATGELCLVLEDDVVPLEGWREGIARILDYPWDYCNLGRSWALAEKDVGVGLVDGFSLTTHAYLLSPEGAQRYRDLFMDPPHFPLDWLPMFLRVTHQMRVLTAKPRLFDQDRTGLKPLIHGVDETLYDEWPPHKAPPHDWWLTGRGLWEKIPGWFHFGNAYDRIVEALPADRPSQFVELGVWMGRSTCYLGETIVGSGKPISLTCIDNFKGSPEHVKKISEDLASGETLESLFRANLVPVATQLGDRFRVIVGDSAESASLFADGSVDAVWIDACHETFAVRRDIAAWWPKLKPSGYMGGDDFSWDTVEKAVREAFPSFEVGHTDGYPWWLVRK